VRTMSRESKLWIWKFYWVRIRF